MTIKVPVSVITMGVKQENAIVDLTTVEVLGRLSVPAARALYPDHVIVNVERRYTEREVDQTELERLITGMADNEYVAVEMAADEE